MEIMFSQKKPRIKMQQIDNLIKQSNKKQQSQNLHKEIWKEKENRSLQQNEIETLIERLSNKLKTMHFPRKKQQKYKNDNPDGLDIKNIIYKQNLVDQSNQTDNYINIQQQNQKNEGKPKLTINIKRSSNQKQIQNTLKLQNSDSNISSANSFEIKDYKPLAEYKSLKSSLLGTPCSVENNQRQSFYNEKESVTLETPNNSEPAQQQQSIISNLQIQFNQKIFEKKIIAKFGNLETTTEETSKEILQAENMPKIINKNLQDSKEMPYLKFINQYFDKQKINDLNNQILDIQKLNKDQSHQSIQSPKELQISNQNNSNTTRNIADKINNSSIIKNIKKQEAGLFDKNSMTEKINQILRENKKNKLQQVKIQENQQNRILSEDKLYQEIFSQNMRIRNLIKQTNQTKQLDYYRNLSKSVDQLGDKSILYLENQSLSPNKKQLYPTIATSDDKYLPISITQSIQSQRSSNKKTLHPLQNKESFFVYSKEKYTIQNHENHNDTIVHQPLKKQQKKIVAKRNNEFYESVNAWDSQINKKEEDESVSIIIQSLNNNNQVLQKNYAKQINLSYNSHFQHNARKFDDKHLRNKYIKIKQKINEAYLKIQPQIIIQSVSSTRILEKNESQNKQLKQDLEVVEKSDVQNYPCQNKITENAKISNPIISKNNHKSNISKNNDLATFFKENEGEWENLQAQQKQQPNEFGKSIDKKRQTTLASILNIGTQSRGEHSSQSYNQQFNSNLAATINSASEIVLQD